MSEFNPQLRAPEQSPLTKFRYYGAAVIAVLAGTAPIISHDQVSHVDEHPYELFHPERSTIITTPTYASVIEDSEGYQVLKSEIDKLLTFEVEGDDKEQADFQRAIESIIDPSEDVLVTSDGNDIIIRTGDFARHHKLDLDEATDKQSSTLIVGINGKLVNGAGHESHEQITPAHTTTEYREKEHTTEETVLYYQKAVKEEKAPLVKRYDEPKPIKKIRFKPAEDLEPQTTLPATEPTLPDDVEPPVAEIKQPEPTIPQKYVPTPPSEIKPEPIVPPEPKPPQDTEPTGSGSGLGGGRAVEANSPAQQPLDRQPPTINLPELAKFARGRSIHGEASHERYPLDDRLRLRGLESPHMGTGWLKKVAALIALTGAIYGWNRAEFSSIEDCQISTPEQPFNITKERGQWIPEFSRPNCPDPQGNVLRITFSGFEKGYATGTLQSDGEITHRLQIPDFLIQGIVKDSASKTFKPKIHSLMVQVDEARKVSAEQSSKPFSPIDFDNQ